MRLSSAGVSPNSPSASTRFVWLPQHVHEACLAEATNQFPYESGGTFMGWWADAQTAVVTAMIGPGPNAQHDPHAFQPDQAWQLDEIARHYAASGRRETYLGDWHSHPQACEGTLSWTDRAVLRRVIKTPAARCTKPLMAVFWGEPPDWHLDMWRGEVHARKFLWDRFVVDPLSVNIYLAR